VSDLDIRQAGEALDMRHPAAIGADHRDGEFVIGAILTAGHRRGAAGWQRAGQAKAHSGHPCPFQEFPTIKGVVHKTWVKECPKSRPQSNKDVAFVWESTRAQSKALTGLVYAPASRLSL